MLLVTDFPHYTSFASKNTGYAYKKGCWYGQCYCGENGQWVCLLFTCTRAPHTLNKPLVPPFAPSLIFAFACSF